MPSRWKSWLSAVGCGVCGDCGPAGVGRCADFLQCIADAEDLGLFDAVPMNPPFAEGADIEQITHVFKMLRSGGRLLAICANDDACRLLLMTRAKRVRTVGPSASVSRSGKLPRGGLAIYGVAMKGSRLWIEWAHGPGAEDGQSLAMSLRDLVGSRLPARSTWRGFTSIRVVAVRCTTRGRDGPVSRAG